MNKALPNFHVSNHPLVRHKITHMHNPEISSQQFYQLMKELGMLMAYEVTANLATQSAANLEKSGLMGSVLAEPKPAIVPVLRSGLAMAEGIREVMPSVRTGHLGILQDEAHNPREYLIALPSTKGRVFIVVDAIIATGNAAIRATEILTKEYDVAKENVLFCVAVATNEGVEKLLGCNPMMHIYAASLGRFNKESNQVTSIFEDLGLGEVGDRLFFGA